MSTTTETLAEVMLRMLKSCAMYISCGEVNGVVHLIAQKLDLQKLSGYLPCSIKLNSVDSGFQSAFLALPRLLDICILNLHSLETVLTLLDFLIGVLSVQYSRMQYKTLHHLAGIQRVAAL